MISKHSIIEISRIFCGDVTDLYSYKSGPALVLFFNDHFGYNDIYGQGFPSRWYFVQQKLEDICTRGELDHFFNIILELSYIEQDLDLTEVAASVKLDEIIQRLNRILNVDGSYIAFDGIRYRLFDKDDDLILLGEGGYAMVYLQKSSGRVIKKLKPRLLADTSARKRFKREFDITKSLADLDGIITVYEYNPNGCSYSMERADKTLEEYVLGCNLSDAIKLELILDILRIMEEVHDREIIHRDLSPNNIFLVSNQIKIADFGLGKDLNTIESYRTQHTNAAGQFGYCSPEQLEMLGEADKRSDVYSLGKIINFVMNGAPSDPNHILRSLVEKATLTGANYRYADAGQMLKSFETYVDYLTRSNAMEQFIEKVHQYKYDEEIECHLNAMRAEELCGFLVKNERGFQNVLIKFMKTSDSRAQYVIQSIYRSYGTICRTYESNDPIAAFASAALRDDFSYIVKETAARILREIAWDVNRFCAQRMVNDLINSGIDPTLEDIISH